MAHVPHLYLPRPWPEGRLRLDAGQATHLERVLRMRAGEEVSYTDGAGWVGTGTLGEGEILRGPERHEPPVPLRLTVAVAPPDARDRLRFLVEKLAELGVERLVWLATIRGEGRPPRPDKARAWAVGALEQSRGAWAMEVGEEPAPPAALPPPVALADPEGADPLPAPVEGRLTIAIGPEGGWEPGELIPGRSRVRLGPRILRVETAAVAAAARLLLDLPP